MASHSGNVVHHGRNVLEDLLVDPLEDVLNVPATLVKPNDVRVVDVAAPMRQPIDKASGEVEACANGLQVGLVHG